MDQQLKQRLVGAAVLIALGVIFIPMLLDDSVRDEAGIRGSNIPPKPEGEFSSSIIPLEPGSSGSELEQVSPAGPGPIGSATLEETGDPAAKESGVDGSTDTRVGLTAWAIQLGSFASQENASKLVERLRASGYSAFLEKVFSEDKAVFRVRVGPELLRSEAQDLRDKLEQEVELKGIVVRYP